MMRTVDPYNGIGGRGRVRRSRATGIVIMMEVKKNRIPATPSHMKEEIEGKRLAGVPEHVDAGGSIFPHSRRYY